MSVEVTETGKKVTFGFRCPVCDPKWIADAANCNYVGMTYKENVPGANMYCENCGALCDSTNFLKEEK